MDGFPARHGHARQSGPDADYWRFHLYLLRLSGIIRRHRWAVQYVDDSPPWAYTIGLSLHGHAEAVMTGIPPHAAHPVLNRVGQACMAGIDVFDPDALAGFFGHPSVVLCVRPVHTSWYATNLFNVARALFGTVPDTVQVVAADASGRFPWQAGHRLALTQPALWEPYPGGWPGMARGGAQT